jgi:hypothetical protein
MPERNKLEPILRNLASCLILEIQSQWLFKEKSDTNIHSTWASVRPSLGDLMEVGVKKSLSKKEHEPRDSGTLPGTLWRSMTCGRDWLAAHPVLFFFLLGRWPDHSS